MPYTITVVGDLTGTLREQGFKESELLGKVRDFVRQLHGVTEATLDLEIRGEIDLRDQTMPGGIFDQHQTDNVTASNEAN